MLAKFATKARLNVVMVEKLFYLLDRCRINGFTPWYDTRCIRAHINVGVFCEDCMTLNFLPHRINQQTGVADVAYKQ